MKVRLVRLEAPGRDGKPRTIYLATTLLDNEAYPTEEIAGLYGQRWSIEVRFRDLKTTMGLEPPCSDSGNGAQDAAHGHDHLQPRQASPTGGLAREAAILADEIGFKGTLDVLVEFRSGFIGLANRPRLLEREREEVLARIGRDCSSSGQEEANRAPSRTRPKAYPYLTTFRGEYVEILHRSRYRKAA